MASLSLGPLGMRNDHLIQLELRIVGTDIQFGVHQIDAMLDFYHSREFAVKHADAAI